MSTTPYFNYNLNKAYSTKIANPFQNALASTNTTGLNTSSTESASSFMVPFPQYGSTAITEQIWTLRS
jgi:hypothetical protein